MKFKTPCFVRVEDAEKRKELIEWLAQIGYRLKGPILNDNLDCIVTGADAALSTNMERFDFWITSVPYVSRIDCGTNVELFKALAAMNDENDYMQWFTDGSEWWLSEYNDFDGCLTAAAECEAGNVGYLTFCEEYDIHKATDEEIVDHFKTTHL